MASVAGVFFLASSLGRSNNWADAPGDNGYCLQCHNTGTSGGSISLSGVPTSYQANTTYSLTLTLTDSDAVVGGFQIVATDGSTNAQIGTFSTPAGTKIQNTNRLVQSTPKSFNSGSVSWTFDWTSPNTASAPTNLQFFYAGNAANGNGGRPGDYSYKGTSLVSTLPVELISFSIEDSDSYLELIWETASQEKLARFEVQRSVDNGATYKTLSSLEAAGTTEEWKSYFFVDDNVPKVPYVLYRLKMIDFGGSFIYSEIRSVSRKMFAHTVEVLSENPLSWGHHILLNVPIRGSIERLLLLKMNGQIALEQNGEFEGEVRLRTDGLTTGHYVLFAYDVYGVPVLHRKVIIQ